MLAYIIIVRKAVFLLIIKIKLITINFLCAVSLHFCLLAFYTIRPFEFLCKFGIFLNIRPFELFGSIVSAFCDFDLPYQTQQKGVVG